VLIGHREHDEVIGTLGEAPESIHVISSAEEVESLEIRKPARVVYLTQTTLSIDDTKEIVARLKERFPGIIAPPSQDICYATQNRQSAVRAIAPQVDLILVAGAESSSNSSRLVEVAQRYGVEARLVGSLTDILSAWLEGHRRIGITAGASTPETLVAQIVNHLRGQGYGPIEEAESVEENVRFALPTELAAQAASPAQEEMAN
jgi:4-hydroxy-3-methylbut-2-enyl diphosphate reductase